MGYLRRWILGRIVSGLVIKSDFTSRTIGLRSIPYFLLPVEPFLPKLICTNLVWTVLVQKPVGRRGWDVFLSRSQWYPPWSIGTRDCRRLIRSQPVVSSSQQIDFVNFLSLVQPLHFKSLLVPTQRLGIVRVWCVFDDNTLPYFSNYCVSEELLSSRTLVLSFSSRFLVTDFYNVEGSSGWLTKKLWKYVEMLFGQWID